MTAPDHRYLVAALRAVDGVADAVVEQGDDAQPGTLRLRLIEGADEVAVSDEVNRMLRTNFRLTVDPDRMQVAGGGTPTSSRRSSALRAAHDPPPGERWGGTGDGDVGEVTQRERRGRHEAPPQMQRGRPPRLTIERVQIVSRDLGVIATVSLGFAGRVFTGEAEGAASIASIHRCVATATLRAVEKAIDGRARFEADHVEIAVNGREQAALTVVTMVTGRHSDRLSGASVVREDVRHAVIRSALSAVNRRVTHLLDGHDHDL